MTEQDYFSDEVLTAYLDDEVDAETRAAIAARLETDTDLQARLGSLQLPMDAFGAFDTLLRAAPELPDLPEAAPAGRSPVWSRAAMAACLVLGLGLGLGAATLREAPAPDWMDYVAAYQALYVPETLDFATPDPGAADAALAALGATLGRDVSAAVPDTVLRFKRGQMLGYQGQALVQLAYLDPAGAPVALCIIRAAPDAASGIELTTLEGLAAAHWQADGFAFLLIGGSDTALIAAAAERMAARL